jgi:hypothetical protein
MRVDIIWPSYEIGVFKWSGCIYTSYILVGDCSARLLLAYAPTIGRRVGVKEGRVDKTKP